MRFGALNGVLIGIGPEEMSGEEEDGGKKVASNIVREETFQIVQMQIVFFFFQI